MTNDPTKPVSPVEFTTLDVRLSFLSLDKKRPNGPGSTKESYQATLLIPPGTDLTPYNAAMKAALLAKFDGKIPKTLKQLPVRDASEKEYAGYDKGWHFLATKCDLPPVLVDQARRPVGVDKFYAGCWARARIRFWAYDNQFGKGVSCDLGGLQFVKDGERLDGRGKPTDPDTAFEALELPDELGSGSTSEPWDPLA